MVSLMSPINGDYREIRWSIYGTMSVTRFCISVTRRGTRWSIYHSMSETRWSNWHHVCIQFYCEVHAWSQHMEYVISFMLLAIAWLIGLSWCQWIKHLVSPTKTWQMKLTINNYIIMFDLHLFKSSFVTCVWGRLTLAITNYILN
jgi:hypothetical protein